MLISLTPPVTHTTCSPKFEMSSTKEYCHRNGFTQKWLHDRKDQWEQWCCSGLNLGQDLGVITLPCTLLLGSALVFLAFSVMIKSCLLVCMISMWCSEFKSNMQNYLHVSMATLLPFPEKNRLGVLKLTCFLSPPFWQRKGEKY